MTVLNKNNIYILGFDRSGTSLIMNCLAHSLKYHAIGETKHLFNNGINTQNTLCACGNIIDECDFWSRVSIKKIQENLNENHQFFHKYIRNIKSPFFLYHWYISKKNKFYNLKTVEDIKYLSLSLNNAKTIDSSKSFNYSKVLDYVNYSESIKIHVVRNVIGVYNSMRKKVKKPEIIDQDVYMYRSDNFLLLSLKWSLTNLYIYFMCRFSKNHHLIKYEDFASDPNKLIDSISKKFKIPCFHIDKNFILDRELNHSISGNPSRMNKSIKIKFDDEWVKSLSFGKRFLIFIINLPVMLLFGYSWKK